MLSSRLPIVLGFLCSLCLCPSCAVSQAVTSGSGSRAMVVLPQPSAQKTFPDAFTLGPSKATFPAATNGYLVAFSRAIKQNPDPVRGIFITSLQNGQQSRVPFWITGASVIHLDAATVTPDQKILVAGSYIASGNADDLKNFGHDPSRPEAVNFIATLDLTGNILSQVRLQDFIPERVCSSDSGSFWVLGQSWTKHALKQEYSMLLHYSSSGSLMNSFLPTSALDLMGPPNFRAGLVSSSAAFLVCNQSSVGVYLQVPTGYLWVDIDINKQTTTTQLSRGVKQAVPTSIAMLPSGDIFASYRSFSLASGSGPVYGPTLGMYELMPSDKRIVRWRPVSVAGAGAAHVSILGHDGPYVLYLMGEAPSQGGSVYWTKTTQ